MKKLVACVVGIAAAFAAYANLASFEDSLVGAQRLHVAKLVPPTSAVNAALTQDAVLDATRTFAAQVLPTGLTVVPGSEVLVMDDEHAKMGRLRLTAEDGSEHLFTTWVASKTRRPFCWAAEGYAAQTGANLDALSEFLRRTVLASAADSKYAARGTASPVSADVVVKGTFSKKVYASPFPRAYVLFIDDDPLSNWGHPCRYVFVKDDLSAFAVWYATEPMKVELDGAELPLDDFGGTAEIANALTLEDTRQALAELDQKTLDNETAKNLVFSGDTSHSYAVLISGGYNAYNNHTRYWGDVSAMFGTLVRKYGIPKSHIYVCMSDGRSTSADVSSGYQSHSYFSGRDSLWDLDGDSSPDVGYSATRSSIQNVFSTLKNTLTSSDQLFVFATDHGSQDDYGNDYICLWGEDMMSVSDFAALTRGIPCPVGYAFEFCYSGGFISTLTAQSGARAVATAASDETSSAWGRTSSVTGIGPDTGIYYMNPWVYYFVAAMRGYFPQVNVTPYADSSYSCTGADRNGDNRVSLIEASNYAKSKIQADGYPETPTYGESPSGTGASFFLAKNTTTSPAISLATALDISSLSFTTGGSASWFGQSATSHDGVDAAQSGAITHYQTNWIQTTVTGPGTLSFYWYVSSEANYDYLEFLVDGVVQYAISGTDNSWTHKSYSVSSGSHTIRWRYRKDVSQDRGLDAGFVDQITWVGQQRTTITFGKNGGTGGTSSVVADYDEAMPRITPPTRTGYRFDGYWDTTGTGGKKYYNADGSSARNWDKRGASTTLWAKWVSVQMVSLSAATDATTFSFSSGGSPGWYGQTEVSHDGVDAARSGAITHNQTNWIETTGYAVSSGTVSFYWKTSSEANYDYLEFLIDGVVQGSISGESTSWTYKSFTVRAGRHTFRWRYRKDVSQDRGLDAGFVDQVTFSGITPGSGSTRITFGKNGGAGGTDSVTATTGMQLTPITPPTRSGYRFDGYWTTTGSGGIKYFNADGSGTRNWNLTASATTLWAKWIRTYAVTLGKNGGTGGSSTVNVAYGKAMPNIVLPVRSGYTFNGYWTTLQSGGVKYYNADGSSARTWNLTTGTTLWALWTKPSQVTFGKNGGTGGSSSVTATYGSSMPRITPPRRSGYRFDGYWTTLNSSSGVKYYNADGSSARVWDQKSNMQLWAKWARLTTVTLGRNGGTGGNASIQVEYGKAMYSIVPPVRSGWEFGGYWTTTGAGGVKYYNADGSSAHVWDKNVATATLWALWVKSYTITFGKNGGTGGTSSVRVQYGRALPQVLVPRRTGYLFGGYWSTTKPGGIQYYNTDGTGTMNWDRNASTTLWAFWMQDNAVNRMLLKQLNGVMPDLSGGTVGDVNAVLDAGFYQGQMADGSGTFSFVLDEDGTTGCLLVLPDGGELMECAICNVGGVLVARSDEGAVYGIKREDGVFVCRRME